MGRKVEGYQQVHVYIKADEYEKFKAIAVKITGLTFKEFMNEAVRNFNGQFEKYIKADKPINIIDLLKAQMFDVGQEIYKAELEFKEKFKELKNDSGTPEGGA